MAATPPTISGVREHADSIINKAVADGRIAPDGTASDTAALTPVFSKGTAALDPNTGKPVVPRAQGEAPPFEAGHVPLESAAPVVAPPGVAPAAAAVVAAQPGTAAPVVAERADAAEAVAQAIVDDYGEFEFEDPDLGTKFTMRAPKQFVETAKRGYGRRTALDRAMSNYKNADPVFRSMVEDGRLNKLLPLIQAALDNKEYGEFVTQGFQRLQQGVPLIEQARAEAAAAGAAAIAAPEESNPFVDPEVVSLRDRTAAMERDWQAFQAERQQQTQTQAQHREQTARNTSLMAGAHQDLAAAYPGVFNAQLGDQDPAWKAAYEYAKDAGYLQRYDLRAAIVFGGQGWRQLEAERIAATASPAAAALATVDARMLDTARREAAGSAATVSGGGVGQAQPIPTPPKPGTKNPDGSMKDQGTYMAEVQAWHQQYGKLKGA